MVSVYRRALYRKRIGKIPKDNNKFDDFFYIVSTENKLIERYEIESARIVISKELRKFKNKNKKFWVYINFDLPFHRKSSHSRMGKGKGPIDSYKKFTNINSVIYKFEGESLKVIINIFKVIQSKLSFGIAIYKNSEFIIGNKI